MMGVCSRQYMTPDRRERCGGEESSMVYLHIDLFTEARLCTRTKQ